jgi:hypothetical protein
LVWFGLVCLEGGGGGMAVSGGAAAKGDHNHNAAGPLLKTKKHTPNTAPRSRAQS